MIAYELGRSHTFCFDFIFISNGNQVVIIGMALYGHTVTFAENITRAALSSSSSSNYEPKSEIKLNIQSFIIRRCQMTMLSAQNNGKW